MSINLGAHQLDALSRMHNGCVLCGDVGSGKSRTAIAYYYICNGGQIEPGSYYPMNDPPMDLYIITTAKKRDSLDWDLEMAPFLISRNEKDSIYSNAVVVDSWNNIVKYKDVENSFFIFDEQRLVGYGAWVHAFLEIAKKNQWILLSATPGDTWLDYMPLFIANGFYKNKTDFYSEHVVYNPYRKYGKPDRYFGIGRLTRLRNRILVDMPVERQTVRHDETVLVDYNKFDYKRVSADRWNIYENVPITNISEYCQLLRRVVNSNPSRIEAVLDVIEKHPRVIIFYNYDYELDMLKDMCETAELTYSEWNGHKHEEIPNTTDWVYIVQYTAGCEGWNCIKTDTIIFYSQNYSYRVMAQAYGRIDRLNTPYKDLYYYHLRSKAPIDLAINNRLKNKKKFNERAFANGITFKTVDTNK